MLNIVQSIFNTGKRPIKITRDTKSILCIDFITRWHDGTMARYYIILYYK